MKLNGEEVTVPLLVSLFCKMLGLETGPGREVALMPEEQIFLDQLIKDGKSRLVNDAWVIGRVQEMKVLAIFREKWRSSRFSTKPTLAA